VPIKRAPANKLRGNRRKGRRPPNAAGEGTMNELTRKPFNNITSYDVEVDLDALREFVNQYGITILPGEWVRFRKGDYFIGRDERKVSPTEPFTLNTGEILIGWIKLEDRKVRDKIVGRVADRFRPPPRESLGDEELIGTPDDPWKPFTAIVMRDANFNISCFTSITISGQQAVMELLRKYLQDCRRHPGMFPNVLLGVGTGRSKKHNTTYPVPRFDIVDWQPWDREPTAPVSTAPAPNPVSAGVKPDLNDDQVPWDDGAPLANPEDFGL
jgi:hypothetical protein